MLTKITTCCYCGTRAVLVLRDHGHMELSCKGCGAPVTHMKQMPTTARPVSSKTKSLKTPAHPARKKSKKKRKKLSHKLFEELWDVVDDIFD